MTVSIRGCVIDDAEDIGRLAAEFHGYLRGLGDDTTYDWGAEKYARDGFGASPAFEGLVAEADGRVVAYALYDLDYDTNRGQRAVYLLDLYVSEAFRRAGIGEKLMERLNDIGRSRGAEYMIWSVLKANALAIRFYERQGAAIVDDVHFMWRAITGRE